MVTAGEPVASFSKLLVELDQQLALAHLEVAQNEHDYESARSADARVLGVLRNLNDRLEKLERFQEGRQ